MVDDWLVDDMTAPPSKRKRHSSSGDVILTQRVKAVQSSRAMRQVRVPLGRSVREGKRRQRNSETTQRRTMSRKTVVEIPSDSEERPRGEMVEEVERDNDGSHYPSDYLSMGASNLSAMQENDMNPFPPTFQQMPFSAQFTHSEQPIRVRVLIEGVHYLIPCPRLLENGSDITVEWLAAKVIDRYFIQHGCRPVLQLTTSEGALLGSTDAVVDVVKEGEEVRAVVERWENPPLSECYLSACCRMRCGEYDTEPTREQIIDTEYHYDNCIC